MSTLDNLRMIDPVLTSLAQGYSNSNLIYDRLFPAVSVSKQKGKVPLFVRESFMAHQTERAVRSSSNRMLPGDIQLINFQTQERDIEAAIDYLEEEEALANLKYEKRLTQQLIDILQLGKEIEASLTSQDINNYESGMYRSLLDSETFDNISSTTNPNELILEGKEAIRNKIAIYPNTMIMGNSTYRVLCKHASILDKIKFNGIQKVTRDMISDIFEIENVYVGMAVHTNDGSTFSDIWEDNIILAYVDNTAKENRTEFNPSFGYTFQRTGMPETDSYYENGGKIKIIRCTDNYGIKITAPDAGYLIKNTNQ